MTEGKFDLKLIPEFDNSASGSSVVEWMEKAELVCKMYQVKHMELIIPLRLMSGAFTVFQQLNSSSDGSTMGSWLMFTWQSCGGFQCCSGE